MGRYSEREQITLGLLCKVGNQASSPQFRLVKDSAAPQAEVYVPAQPALAFRVNWQGQDSQAGVAYYDLQYREKEAQDWSNWLDWQTGTQETSARFVGQAGYEYQFRVRAADRVGNLGEWVTGSLAAVQNVTIYYYAGSVRVAMRQGERVTYLLADHLGSTQVTADEQGSELGRYLYTAWGETRQVSGETATDRLYTGQRQEAEIGLYYYNARWYDPALGRFTQADTIVPNSNYPLAYDRYAYSRNNPVRYVDPSGHNWWDVTGQFATGFVNEFLLRNIGWISPNGQRDLGVKTRESSASLLGRVAADVATVVLGVDNFVSGAAVATGGTAVACGTTLCLGAVGTIAGGVAVAAVGAGQVTQGAIGLGGNLALLSSNASASGESPEPTSQQFPNAPDNSQGVYQSPYGFPKDPASPPTPDFMWEGKGLPGSNQGNWVNPTTGEWLHWDPSHHGIGHFDYGAANGNRYRIWPDGSMSPK